MVTRQISFGLVDHELLANAQIRDSDLIVGPQRFKGLVLPADVKLPEQAAETVKKFEDVGGMIFRAEPSLSDADFGKLASIYENGALSVKSDRIVVGRFERDERHILLVVNVAAKAYTGAVRVEKAAEWLAAEPGSGQVERAKVTEAGRIAVSLPPRGAVLLISPRKR